MFRPEDEFIGFAVDGVKRMQHLIQDLLAHSRVGRGAALQTVDASGVIREVLGKLTPRMEALGARVTVEPLPVVAADEVLLGQLFHNLIGNALKFPRADTPLHVHVSAQRASPETWTFSVRDNGIDFQPDHFEQMSVLFQRLHTKREGSAPGIGLLRVCKEIVERHGGRIWVDSKPGEGTTFSFTLRAAEELKETAPLTRTD